MLRRWQCRVAETMRAGATALNGSAGAARLILKENNAYPERRRELAPEDDEIRGRKVQGQRWANHENLPHGPTHLNARDVIGFARVPRSLLAFSRWCPTRNSTVQEYQ